MMGSIVQLDSVSEKLQTFAAHVDGVNCVKIGPCSQQVVVTGGEDKKVNLWRIGRPSCLLSIKAAKTPIRCVSFDPEERVVGSGSLSGSIHLFALNAGGKTKCRLNGHRAECTSLAFHPLGSVIVSGSVDTNVKVWDIRNKNCARTFMGHTGAVTCTEYSPDGRWVVSGSDDKTAKLWDLQSGKLLHEFLGHRGGISTVKFHPEEFWLATGSLDGTVKYWDLETFKLVGSTPTERGSAIRQISFSAKSHQLICSSDEGTRAWNWQPCRCLASDTVDWGTVAAAEMSQDKHGDEQLITCCLNQKSMVSIWSVNTTKLLQKKKSTKLKTRKAFAEDDEEEARSSARGFNKGMSENVSDNRMNRPEKITNQSDDETSAYEEAEHHEMEVQSARSVETKHENIKVDKQTKDSSKSSSPTLLKKKKKKMMMIKNAQDGDEEEVKSARSEGKIEKQDHKHIKLKKEKPIMKSMTKVKPKSAQPVLPIMNQNEKVDKETVNDKPKTAMPTSSSESSLRLIRMSKDQPLDLSISEFMLPKKSDMLINNSKTIHCEMKLSVVDEILNGHGKFQTAIQERLEEADHVSTLWNDGQQIQSLEYLETLQNDSVSLDFFKYINFRNGQTATLDICAAALPVLGSLLKSPFEDHIKTALSTSKFLFDSFSDIIASTLDHQKRSARSRGSVDISREERIEKCARCAKGFHELSYILEKLVMSAAMNQLGRTKREAELLHEKLQKFQR